MRKMNMQQPLKSKIDLFKLPGKQINIGQIPAVVTSVCWTSDEYPKYEISCVTIEIHYARIPNSNKRKNKKAK